MRAWLVAIFLHLGLLGFLIGLPQFGKIQSLPQDSGGIPAFLAGSYTQVKPGFSANQVTKLSPGSSSQSGNSKIIGLNQAPSQNIAPKNMQALLDALDQNIQQHLIYPDWAEVHIEQGSVLLAFDLAPDGQINDISVEKSSGDEDLDQAAVKAVEESSPVSMPIHLNQSIHLSLPVNFSLE